MSQTVSKNIFWLTASRITALALLFVAYSQLLRYLGPEQYGRFQFVLAYVMIFSTFVDFGVQQFVTKKLSEDWEHAGDYFRSFFAFELIASVLLYGLLVVVAWRLGYDHTVLTGVSLAGAGMVANALCYPYLAVLSARQDLRRVAVINFLNSMVNVSVIALAIVFHKGIVFLASVQLIFGLIDLFLYRRHVKDHLEFSQISGAWSFPLKPLFLLIRGAWPFVLLVGFSSIYNRIDQVLITRILGFEQNGFYGAAYKVFDLLAFFPAVISHTLYPHFAQLSAAGDIPEIRNQLERYLRLTAMVAFPLAVGGSILSTGIVQLVAGSAYVSAAAPSLKILVWAPAVLLLYIPYNALAISQLTKKAALVTGINVVLNVVGNLLLLRHFGIAAAAGLTVLAEVIQGICYGLFVRQSITKFSFFSIVYRPVLCAAGMGVVLFVLPAATPLLVAVAIGALVYCALLGLSGFVTLSDLRDFRSIVR